MPLINLIVKYLLRKYGEPLHIFFEKWTRVISKNRSIEGCSKLKSPETRQVQEILVSTLEYLQAPKWDRTRCPEE